MKIISEIKLAIQVQQHMTAHHSDFLSLEECLVEPPHMVRPCWRWWWDKMFLSPVWSISIRLLECTMKWFHHFPIKLQTIDGMRFFRPMNQLFSAFWCLCECSAQKILWKEIDKDPIELSGQIFTFVEELFEKNRGKKKLGKAGLWPIALGL